MADTIWGPGYNLEDRVRLSELRVFQFNIWPFDFWSLSLLRDVNIRTHQVWSFGASHAWDCLSVSGYLGLYVYGSAPPPQKNGPINVKQKPKCYTAAPFIAPLHCDFVRSNVKVNCAKWLDLHWVTTKICKFWESVYTCCASLYRLSCFWSILRVHF